MTLKEELEVLRGEPIFAFSGDPTAIPCVETSDPIRLCKSPVVSVHMVTYNHEPYIRQAIEGVLSQKTDFEFELVIGEDCSTDRTLEICLDYQRRFPEKVRVITGERNLYRNPCPEGDNWRRNLAHCRGEYIAICEGDDYWIDPLKLQKQADAMRSHKTVSLCFTGGHRFDVFLGRYLPWGMEDRMQNGLRLGKEFFDEYLTNTSLWIFTASLMVRKSSLEEFCNHSSLRDIYSMRLRLADLVLILAMSTTGDVYMVPDDMIVYRQGCGIMTTDSRISIDAYCVRYWFSKLSRDPVPIARAMVGSVLAMRIKYARCLPRGLRVSECKLLRHSEVFANSLTVSRRLMLGVMSLPLPSFVFTLPLCLHRRMRFLARKIKIGRETSWTRKRAG